MVGRSLFVGVMLALSLAPVARAQDVVGKVWTPPAGEVGSETTPPPSKVEDVAPRTRPVDEAPHLRDLDVSLELPTYRWLPRESYGADFVREVALTRLPPGSLLIRYEGLEGLFVRKLHSRMKKMWRDTLHDAWEGEVLDDLEYEAEVESMYQGLADFRAGGRWWERTWLESLPPEKGGAPATPFVHTYGRKIEVLKLGPLSVTNDLRARIDNFTVLSLDPDNGQIYRDVDVRRLAREHAQLRRDDSEDELPALGRGEDPDEDDGTQEPLMRLTLEPPAPDLLPANWALRFRPSASIRVTDGLQHALRDVSMRVTLELYLGTKRLKFMEIEALAAYELEENDARLGVQLALITW